MSLTKHFKIKLPMMPNFLTVETGGTFEIDKPKIDVKDLSDAEIEQLGKDWTIALKLHAQTRRKNIESV